MKRCIVGKSKLWLFALLCTLLFVRISSAADIGTNCEYLYSDSGATLTIQPKSGFSECTLPSNTEQYGFPWVGKTSDSYVANVTKVVIKTKVKTAAAADYLFANLLNATVWEGLKNLDVSASTSLKNMFTKCSSLSSLEGLETWNVSNVTNLANMFSSCKSLTSQTGLEYLKDWNVNSVTNMGAMFSSCSGLTSLSKLDNWKNKLTCVTNMNNMFNGCSGLTSLEGLENWNVSHVTSMNGMFGSCSGLTSLSKLENWDVSHVTDMGSMFNSCSGLTGLEGIGDWNVSSVTNMKTMFNCCYGLTSQEAIMGWNVSNVTAMGGNAKSLGMFSKCFALKKADFSQWDFSNLVHKNMLYDIDDNGSTIPANKVFKLNQYYTDMLGTKIYVVGKHSYEDFTATDLTSAPSNLVFEPYTVTVNFTDGTGTATLTANTYTGDYYTNVCAQYPDEAICDTNAVKGRYISGTDCEMSFTPDNGAVILLVIATDEKGNKTTLTAPYKLENIQSNYTVEVKLIYPVSYAVDSTNTHCNEYCDISKLTSQLSQAAGGATVNLPSNTDNNASICTCGNYTFIGWTVTPGASGGTKDTYWIHDKTTFTMPNTAATLSPLFTYTQYPVVYDGDGAVTGTFPQTQYAYYGTLATVYGNPQNPTEGPVKPGFVFNSWEGTIDGVTKTFEVGDTFVMPENTVTLKAKYTSGVTYTITYQYGDAESGSVPAEQTNIPEGTTVKLRLNDGALAKTGYEFTYWSDGLKWYAPGSDFLMPAEDVTLWPVFAEVIRREPLPEDEIGTYSFDENGNKFYIQFHNYDICMSYMGDDNLCRNTSVNLYN